MYKRQTTKVIQMAKRELSKRKLSKHKSKSDLLFTLLVINVGSDLDLVLLNQPERQKSEKQKFLVGSWDSLLVRVSDS